MKRALFICLLIVSGQAACKSAEGERCQVDKDCEPGLVCNKAKNVCSSGTGGGIDASVPDGPPADAAVDAMPDAM